MASVPHPLPALQAAEADAQRRRAKRAHLQRMVAANYGSDTVLLLLFHAAGTIDLWVVLAWVATSVAVTAAFFAIFAAQTASESRPRPEDWQLPIAAAVQLVFAALAPPVAFVFLTNLFIVFAFGVMRLQPRGAFTAWAAMALGLAVVLWLAGGRLTIPHGSGFEAALVWLTYTSAFGRYVLLGVLGTRTRRRLRQQAEALAASVKQAEELAGRDGLTGALNRRAMSKTLAEQIAGAQQDGRFCIALFDLDHFKQINDTHGHVVGDQVLQTFVRLVQESLRGTDVLCRYGGEEFLAVLAGTPPAAAVNVVERVRALVAAHDWSAVARGAQVRVSAGLAAYRSGDDAEVLIARADRALYQAKNTGRDRVILAD